MEQPRVIPEALIGRISPSLSEEKICSPSAGPHSDNSRRSRGGAPPGPSEGDPWPGFPHLEIARVVGPPSALMASGESNFLLPSRVFAILRAERPGRWASRHAFTEAVAAGASRDRWTKR